MSAPVVDQLPQDPQKSQGVKVFNINAKSWTAALSTFTDQINALATWINNMIGFAVIVVDPNETYTLEDAHRGEYRRMTRETSKTISVPTLASSSPCIWNFRNVGAANLTISPAGGVTITPNAGGTLVVPQNGSVSIIRVGVNSYEIIGQTVAA